MSNPRRGKWFKFNDTTVEEFEMTERNLAEECFGGTYKSKVYEKGSVKSTGASTRFELLLSMQHPLQ